MLKMEENYLIGQAVAKKVIFQLQPGDYTNWAPAYPDNAGRKNVVKVVQKGFSAKWQNDDEFRGATRYICQVHACDTDNYCDSVE